MGHSRWWGALPYWTGTAPEIRPGNCEVPPGPGRHYRCWHHRPGSFGADPGPPAPSRHRNGRRHRSGATSALAAVLILVILVILLAAGGGGLLLPSPSPPAPPRRLDPRPVCVLGAGGANARPASPASGPVPAGPASGPVPAHPACVLPPRPDYPDGLPAVLGVHRPIPGGARGGPGGGRG